MKQSHQQFILEKMAILKGAKISYIGRIAATGDICFESNDKKEYFLHIQTAFRIRKEDEISIANLDMFEPTETLENSPSFDWKTFNWDVQGFNQYDEWTKKYNKDKDNQVVVQNIDVNILGDFTVKCSHGVIMEIFTNATDDKECWRFFEKTSKNHHLVVTGQGIEE